MPDIFVQSFTHLKDRPKADQALQQLQRVASLVKPIMRKHSWVLPMLAEFFPDNPSLLGLNVNMGQKILIRLRPPHAPDTFYPDDDVVHTMLHELTHNVHGPHDDAFYKYLAGLEEEFDALKRSGYAGEGFHSPGHRVGTNVSHNLPPHLARSKALEAAEKRRKLGRLGDGGRRLGGSVSEQKRLTPRELAARAALRRARDEVTCGSSEIAEREAEKAAKEGTESKVIDLTKDSDSDEGPVPTSATAGPNASKTTQKSAGVARNSQQQSRSTTSSTRQSTEVKPSRSADLAWTCEVCTLINDNSALQCVVCLSNRPRDPASIWFCLTCGAENEKDFWMCKLCTTIKTNS